MARKLLIVEDDPQTRRNLARLLVLVGFSVSSAATVREGLLQLDGQDIVVIDLHLPDSLGTVLLREIRRENRPVRTAIFTCAFDAADLIADGPQPDALFDKSETTRLLAWIGEP